MPFFEIKQEILQEGDKKLIFRFFMDTNNNINLHIWSNLEGNIERFQLSNPGKIIQWKKSLGLLSGFTDDEAAKKPGIKASPLIQFKTKEDTSLIESFATIIKHALKDSTSPASLPLNSILTFVLEKITNQS